MQLRQSSLRLFLQLQSFAAIVVAVIVAIAAVIVAVAVVVAVVVAIGVVVVFARRICCHCCSCIRCCRLLLQFQPLLQLW